VPRISVVVPIYNVEDFLDECLGSIAAQTFRDLEVVMVNDGSPDRSPAIAAAWAERDSRFRLVNRPNGGLGAARNTGTEHASAEYLTFVDSDDVLPERALERLITALDRTGSDFATGNVLRLSSGGTRQAYFVSRAFTRTRLRTHVTKHRDLITDRTAWNKLWRRSFWDAQGYRFPEGVYNEDIPVTIPAHFAARAVDVIAEPTYLWRSRDAGEKSITQRRREVRALVDRLNAVEQVIAHLDAHGPPGSRLWYEQSVLAHDLRYHLVVFDEADGDYRELFLDRVNALIDAAGPRVCDGLPAADRRLWDLVRERRPDELAAAVRAQRAAAPPLRVRLARRIPERHRRRLRGLVQSVRS
jgi:CDP-glycerol glycerophosphotransferase